MKTACLNELFSETLQLLCCHLDVCCQEEVAEFGLGLCCAEEEERGETPGREDSPSDLGEAELDPGGDPKTAEDKAFGRNTTIVSYKH